MTPWGNNIPSEPTPTEIHPASRLSRSPLEVITSCLSPAARMQRKNENQLPTAYKLSDLLHLPWFSDELGCLWGMKKKRNIRQGLSFLAFEGIKSQKCFQLAFLSVSQLWWIYFLCPTSQKLLGPITDVRQGVFYVGTRWRCTPSCLRSLLGSAKTGFIKILLRAY